MNLLIDVAAGLKYDDATWATRHITTNRRDSPTMPCRLDTDTVMVHGRADGISFRTDADCSETGIGVYRETGDNLLLHVVAPDGSGRINFEHRGGDREQSAAFFLALAEEALRLRGELAYWPLVDHDANDSICSG
jgi:hypothetical protein